MTQTLFSQQEKIQQKNNAPLAEKLRPLLISDFEGQNHLIGANKPISKMIQSDELFSFILWGPPGTGKTTITKIIAQSTKSHFIFFSASTEGIKRFKEIVKEAQDKRAFEQKRTILFVDEIHRLNKNQQDTFLPYAETGEITFIGATTENPSFEVNSALLSRMRVFVLKRLNDINLTSILNRALNYLQITLEEKAQKHLINYAQGDARTLLNSLEFTNKLCQKTHIKLSDLENSLQKKALRYDKTSEEHYNLISALHKSLRDSDADASLYWLSRMLEAGESPLFLARRMVRFASEDIGNADPQALQISLSAKSSYEFLGSPEGELALAQCAVYLARAPKSNEIYRGYNNAQKVIKETGTLSVPHHIRNAPTSLMKDLGYGKGYKYAHDYENAKVNQEHFPKGLEKTKLL